MHANRLNHVHLGGLLLLPLSLAMFLEVRWEIIEDMASLKACSGALILVYLAAQWRVAYLRMTGRIGAAARQLGGHRVLGALGPLILYLHAPSLGPGYLAILAYLFLGNVALALVDRHTLRAKAARIHAVWLVLHISLSVVITIMAAFHAGTAVYYR